MAVDRHVVLLHALNQQIHNSRLELLTGAGHLSNLEAPDRFSGALHDFLTTLR